MAVGVSVRMLAIVAMAVLLSRATAQPAPVTASPGPESDGGGGSSNTAGIVGGLVGGLVGLGILVCFLYMKCIRKPKAAASESAPVSQYLKTGFIRNPQESDVESKPRKHSTQKADVASPDPV